MNEKPLTKTKFLTDTATIAVFDPTSLRHRNEDTCDWWSIPGDEIQEVSKARMVTVDLGADGVYECEIYRDRDTSTAQKMQVVANLETKMGTVYVGAGEEIPGGGTGPETIYGGVLVALPAGVWKVGLSRRRKMKLELRFGPTSEEPVNLVEEPLHLP